MILFKKRFFLVFQMVFFIWILNGQTNSVVRSKMIFVDSTSVKIDTFSIILGSFSIQNIDPSLYKINYTQATLSFLDSTLLNKNLYASYRVIEVDFSQIYFKKPKNLILQKGFVYTPQTLNVSNNWLNAYNNDAKLVTNGAISRGFSIGNNQDFVLNSSLNLQITGQLAPDIEIKANITDKNVPIQPEGNTRNIQDFDRIFITIDFKKKLQIRAGDIEITKPNSYFLLISKKTLGMELATTNNWKTNYSMNNKVGGGVSKGKYCKQKLNIVNGRQGPYKLNGNLSNTSIMVLSGSERVYVDNKLMIRGSENDYTIDYNLGEITFTAKMLITSEKLIYVEYEFSDLSYSKYNLYSFNEFKSEKNKNLLLKVNFFHEQDLPNRSIQPSLTDSMKFFMSNLNNDIIALYPSVDTSDFYPNEILYKKSDTIYNLSSYQIYIHTTMDDGTLYRLNFTYLGPNKGNYKILTTGNNGRVFFWIAPLNGIPQGDYEPVILLQTPKLNQVGTLGADFEISKSLKLSSEFAFSNYDKNLFSQNDDHNNIGFAYFLKLIHNKSFIVKNVANPEWNSSSIIGYEYIHKNFKTIESHRSIEFNKDFNLSDTYQSLNGEHMFSINTNLANLKLGNIEYSGNFYSIENKLNALKNNLISAWKWNSFHFKTNSSYLSSNDSLSDSYYIRTFNQLSKTFKFIEIGVYERFEMNRFFSIPTDTLIANSFAYNEIYLYFQNNDSLKYKYYFQIKNINTQKPSANNFYQDQYALESTASFEFSPYINNTLKGTATFRNNHQFDPTQNESIENFFIASLDYNARFLKNVFTLSTFYETGSGLEQKKIFSFFKVASGQGTHVWVDYNGNNIEELNEFEIAAFQNEADYIKIWITSNDYINTFNTQFYQVINIKPYLIWKEKKGVLKFLSRLSNISVLRMSQKNTNQILFDAINPFNMDYNDTLIVNSNVNISNNLAFNSNSQIWGVDYYFKFIQNKSIVYYGPEGTNIQSHEWVIRSRPIKKILLKSYLLFYEKNIFSSFFESKNYKLHTNIIKADFNYFFSNTFSCILTYSYKYKVNVLGLENAKINELEMDVNYRIIDKGVLQFKIKYAYVNTNIIKYSNLSYDMLEALSKGNNILLTLLYQTKINEYLLIDFQYNGRVTNAIQPIHTGALQLKVLF